METVGLGARKSIWAPSCCLFALCPVLRREPEAGTETSVPVAVPACLSHVFHPGTSKQRSCSLFFSASETHCVLLETTLLLSPRKKSRCASAQKLASYESMFAPLWRLSRESYKSWITSGRTCIDTLQSHATAWRLSMYLLLAKPAVVGSLASTPLSTGRVHVAARP